MSKETFKVFVRNHPSLVDYVSKGTMTWQKFYELYDLYGEDENVWNAYFTTATGKNLSDTSFKDIFGMLKNIDMDSFQKGIEGMQKAIGLIQDFSLNKNNEVVNEYNPRPSYKHFED